MEAFFTQKPQENGDSPVTTPIHICLSDEVNDLFDGFDDFHVSMARAQGFAGKANQLVKIPGKSGEIELILFGAGSNPRDEIGPVRTGKLSSLLEKGNYRIETFPKAWDSRLMAIGWGLGSYKFDKYLKDKKEKPRLDLSGFDDAEEIVAIVEGITLGRDLINTPSNDMGPVALEDAGRALASRHGANVRVTEGQALLDNNYPMIHAVGRAAHEAPRLLEIEWGDPEHPRLAIVGKGITFDTGGVNIKSASSARLMKKDMGGAAHAVALAHLIMANNLPLRLHVLLAIAENAVSAGAYRPGDILQSRIGKTIEIDNTDAEGRLVLGDALTRASEDKPALIIDFATLTGAARVALGPKLPPFFCNTDAYVRPVLDNCSKAHDPVWQLPLWDPYFKMLGSPIADMKNAGGGFAGSITAALFLKQFVVDSSWMHFDVYGWNPSSAPGHPAGGEIFAVRGLYDWLKSGPLAGNKT